MIKNRYAVFILFVVLVLVFWNVLDYLYASFITRSAYHFTAGGDLLIPLVVGLVMGYDLFLRKRKGE